MDDLPMKELEADVIKLRGEVYQRDMQIALFREVVIAVRERLDLDEIYQMVAEFAKGLISAETVLIPVMDESCSTYTYRAGCGKNAEEAIGETLDRGMGICGWVWEHKQAWWRGVLHDLSEEERGKWQKQAGTVILVPLIGSNHFLGGIAGFNKVGGGEFDRADLDLLALLASQVAIAIDNRRLITQLGKANQALASEKERVQVTLSSIGDAVITTDAKGRIEYLNPVAEKLFSVTLQDAHSKLMAELCTLFSEEDRQPAGDLVSGSLNAEELPYPFRTLVLVRTDGEEFIIESSAAPIFDPNGGISGVVLVFRDISQTRELTRQLSYQATHDALTGLLNRSEFEYRVKQAIRDVQVSGNTHCLLHMGLDQFKVINDTCGHVAGDELLKQYGAMLTGVFRQGSTLARIGGDEFGLLLENCSVQQAERLAGQIQALTRDFRFIWDEKSFTIGVSMGLIEINRMSKSVIQVMSSVDAACNMAKETGRNRLYRHDEADQALNIRLGEMQWTPRIIRAIEEQRMLLYFQPIVLSGATEDHSSHYEILIRMQDESGSVIPPVNFLPAAERYNLITTIDRWVITHYFSWLAEHPEHMARLEFGSVNLSGRSLSDENCLIHIENMLREYAIPARKICFEITETEAIGNLPKAIYFINRLKSLGCSFALDDFGSGLSSYAYLKNLPVDFLKIDGMFVKDIVSDPTHYAMVESINHIGHVMGRKTIAEFVENQEIATILGKLGVDYLQGYGIAKPRPLGEMK
jgi:diguanylate cyclase (GGDEF)-like protein/PAS domain S-box-containing protein